MEAALAGVAGAMASINTGSRAKKAIPERFIVNPLILLTQNRGL